jgi:tetratricopeptide (TPR) repeat protein
MKKLLFIIFLFGSLSVFADDNQILIEEANKNYNEARYQDAADLYEKVLLSGYESPKLYYNLGNCYFKLKDMASAILNFEKAKKLDPGDEDVNFNLKIANNSIVDKIETVPDLFYIRWWNSLTHFFTVDQWGMLSLISFIILLSFALLFLLSGVVWIKKYSFWLGIVFLVITVSSYSMANARINSFKKDHEAIVFAPTVTVKSSPSENSIDLFVIHSGTKVQLTDHVGDWYEVKIANGSVGWLMNNDIKKI